MNWDGVSQASTITSTKISGEVLGMGDKGVAEGECLWLSYDAKAGSWRF